MFIEESGTDLTVTVEGQEYHGEASADFDSDTGGEPAHDTDGDAVDDSVVVTDSDGDMLIHTDADEDGDVDYTTEITGDGHVTVSEHTGDGDWTVVERGHLDDSGAYHHDEESGWITSGRSEVHVDPRTGHWIHGG